MRLTPTTALAALCWTARLASARTGHVHIIDPEHSQQHGAAKTLSPVAARLVLAQRAGVEDYHSEDLVKAEVLDAINEFGVKTPLFGQKAEGARHKAFVLVEGVQDAEVTPPALQDYTSFALSPAPGATANRGLWIDLAKQAQPSSYSSLSDDEAIEQMSDLYTVFSGLAGDKFYITTSISDLESLVRDPVVSSRYSITAYIAPTTQSSRNDDVAYPWGTYTLPSSQSPLRKRDSARPSPEKPLELEPEATTNSVAQSFSEPIQAFASNNTSPLPGILPQCFATQAQCESTTRNCSGHGKCYKKYTDQSADKNSRTKDCFTCQCSATVQKTSEGRTKTTYWGGSACQKRDISVQFWIIALFTVGLVFLVSFAVGSVLSMGQQELPSVIGAGVSGPVRK